MAYIYKITNKINNKINVLFYVLIAIENFIILKKKMELLLMNI